MATTAALERISRGRDSSGRVVFGTRQAFQRYDKISARVGGKLVIVQGAWSNASASAGTHSKAGCFDYRRWNLSNAEAVVVVHTGRDLSGATWERYTWQGFDPHFHDICIGDSPMDSLALSQIEQYKAGLDGLAGRRRDPDPYRPKVIRAYVYEENDMTPEESKRLERVETKIDRLHARVNEAFKAERERDAAERKTEAQRHKEIKVLLGETRDDLGLLYNSLPEGDTEARKEVRQKMVAIMRRLKDDPDVTDEDNPSDDAMAEIEGG